MRVSEASAARAKAVKDANKNRSSRAASDLLRAEACRLRKQTEEAEAQHAAQKATIAALQKDIVIAEAAAVSLSTTR